MVAVAAHARVHADRNSPCTVRPLQLWLRFISYSISAGFVGLFWFFFQPETNHKPDKYRSEFRVHPPLLRPFWHRHLPSVFYLTCNRLLGVIKPQEGTTWTSVDLQLRGLLPFQWPHWIRGQNLFPDKQTLVKSVPVKTVMEDQHVQI